MSRKQEEALTAETIRTGLATRVIGRSLVYLPETGSTNAEAKRLAEAGAVDGTVVVSDHQTAGRGRLGRPWQAPAGTSLLLSVVFRPHIPPGQAQRLTMCCALAVADAVEALTGLAVGLKWPNDVVLGEGKLGGILTEMALRGEKLDYAVVGIGLNVNLDPHRLRGSLLWPATSLSWVLGRNVSRLELLGALLQAVERRYLALTSGRSPLAEWTRRLVTLGRPVIVAVGETRVEGEAVGVNEDGALLVRRPDGTTVAVVAGDVTLNP